MPSYYDEDWDRCDIGSLSGEETDEEYVDEDESYYSDAHEDDNEETNNIPIRSPRWRKVCIEGQLYDISDHGMMKPSGSLFEVSGGLEDQGTPYKTFMFPCADGSVKIYYVHDVVYRAFHGEPPDGWEVRHKVNETRKGKRYYNNSLKSLTIMPKRVQYRPSIFT